VLVNHLHKAFLGGDGHKMNLPFISSIVHFPSNKASASFTSNEVILMFCSFFMLEEKF
jgi:hypothetical protein